MFRKLLLLSLTVLLALSVASCNIMPQAVEPTLAAGNAAPLAGGGGQIVYSGTSAQQGVVVTGTGTANAEPEVVHLMLGVELRGPDAAAIVNDAAQDIDALNAALLDLGINEGDIRTANYSLWVENVYEPETGRPTDEVVYHLSHQLRVTLRDIDRVGDVLAGAVDAGVNQIAEVSFSVEDPQVLLEQARVNALEDARGRAEELAAGLDIQLGTPTLVTEIGGSYPVEGFGMGGGGAVAMDVAAPSITPGSFSVTVSVQVVYSIQ